MRRNRRHSEEEDKRRERGIREEEKIISYSLHNIQR